MTTSQEIAKPQSILKNGTFRLLWFGQGVSILGDQFFLIALPWLVLQLTGDVIAVGTVLALAGVPRALFMLVGGALTDRFSPRLLMVLSNTLSMILVGLIAVLLITDTLELWMLYAFALIFGVVDAFYFPASSSIVPQIVHRDQLQTGNAFIQGTGQLGMFLGPVLAGIVIATFAGEAQLIDGESVPDKTGIILAMLFDGLTFLVANIALGFMRLKPRETDTDTASQSVVASIKQGVLVVWNNVGLRTVFFTIAGINLLVNGPIAVGLPILAKDLPEGAAAFGAMMSAYGGGALLGTLLAGVLPKPAPRYFGPFLFSAISLLGVGLVFIGLLKTLLLLIGVALIMGIAEGYVVILFITWLQGNTPEMMLGRIMSVMMFFSNGLQPVSNAFAGVMIDISLVGFFVGSGVIMSLMTLIVAFRPVIRHFGEQTIIIDGLPESSPIVPSTASPKRSTQTQEIVAIGD